MTVVKYNTNNSVYQKWLAVKLSSAIVTQKLTDILAVHLLKNFKTDSIFRISPEISFLQLETALLAYNLNEDQQTCWKNHYRQYRPWNRILVKHLTLMWLDL